MSRDDSKRFTIIGAGLNGALMTNYLARAGYRVDVYERRSDPRGGGFAGGRSINLAISERGINGLRGIGLADEILELAIPMRGRMIHAPDGSTTFQPYDQDPKRYINSISRAGLNIALLEAAAKHENVRLHFDCKCLDVDFDRPAARIARGGDADADAHWTDGNIVVGADGAFSAVRRAMERLDRFEHREDRLAHGYKELTIPAGSDGGFRLEPHALHIWPRRAFMMIALPNQDKTFTCTLFWPLEGENSFERSRSDDEIREYFDENFAGATALMPALLEEYKRNPVGSLVTVRCAPWRVDDKVVLIGDAAHAIVPFYGQGMNAGFEDCVELDRCLRECAPDIERALSEYYRRRKPNADAIADLALYNFVEMRDHAGTRRFRIWKALERVLHRALGFWYVPLYTMVSFTNIPYAEAVRRAKVQRNCVIGAAVVLLILVIVLIVWLIGRG